MAGLIKLTKENIKETDGKDIYLINFFPGMYRELYEKFPELNVFTGIYDNRVRNRGSHIFNEVEYDVKGFEEIQFLTNEAVFIIVSGYYEDDFKELNSYELPECVSDTVYYFVNKNTEIYQSYVDKYKDHPLEDIIVFRSGPGSTEYVKGTDYSDNAKALFDHMMKNVYSRKWRLVWLVKYPEEYGKEKKLYPDVEFISYDWSESEDLGKRDKYYRAVCLAKFIFFTDACAFCRYPREGQIRVQLWHGCGYKKRRQNDICTNKYEYMPVCGDAYGDVHCEVFGLKKEQILVTGYPKLDWIFHPIEKWTIHLGIKNVSKYIFWLPTYRQVVAGGARDLGSSTLHTETGLPIVDTEDQLTELNHLLYKNDAVLFVKLHPVQSREQVLDKNYSNIVIMDNKSLANAGIHINQILAYADGLLSDYSSVMVDYLLLDRPVGITTDDLDDYEKERGFVFRDIKEWLPGELIRDYRGLTNFIKGVLNGTDPGKDKRQSVFEKMFKFRDDRNCERLLNRLGVER